MVFQNPEFFAGLHYDIRVIASDTNVMGCVLPGPTHSESVEKPEENRRTRPIRADEIRQRLALPETRPAIVAYLVNLYRVSRDWRLVADTAGISHRTISRYLRAHPELGEGARAARATWTEPHGLAGYNARRAASAAS